MKHRKLAGINAAACFSLNPDPEFEDFENPGEELNEETLGDVDIQEPLAEYAFNTLSNPLEVDKEDLVDALPPSNHLAAA
ncbi:hypothetical protein BHE90_006490, partial [Fusarium euwallaceae]